MPEKSQARPKRHGTTGDWVVAVKHGNKWKNASDVSDGVSEAVLAGIDPAVGLTEPEIQVREVDVLYEWESGQVRKVRLEDEPVAARPVVKADPDSVAAKPEQFLNPYGFVSAAPRGESIDESWQDRAPVSLSSAAPGTWSGRISVDVTTLSPLLCIDDNDATAEVLEDRTHWTYGVRTTRSGAPELPATTFKGALRSAYEAITSSRFGVWSSDWDRPLAFREPANVGAAVKPVRIDDVPDDRSAPVTVTVFEGCQAVDGHKGIQAAGWLPTYDGGPGEPVMVAEDGRTPAHGEELWAELHLIRRTRGNQTVLLWRVSKLADTEAGLGRAPLKKVWGKKRNGGSLYERVDGVEPLVVRGFVVLTGRGIPSKHDERFAFEGRRITVDRLLLDSYDDVLSSYRKANERELKEGRVAGMGLHLTDPDRGTARAGLWAFARGGNRVTAIVPVHIGRQPWKVPPRELAAQANLLPPRSVEELSAADRVFGWVAGRDGQGAHKGQLRVHSSVCTSQDLSAAIEDLNPPVTLAILGQPKPAQGRFYAAGSDGRPIDATEKADLYRKDSQLRGRKFYWHHAGKPEGDQYWSIGGDFRDGHMGWFREYCSVTGQSDQNRSVRSWVRRETTFRVELDVVNLTTTELGALLWLCGSVPGASIRAGYGKPLGFGSLHLALDLDGTSLWQARADDEEVDLMANRYRSLSAETSPDAPNVTQATARAVQGALDAFNDVKPKVAVRQYQRLAKGDHELRVHYPRVGEMGQPKGPDPDLPSYEWFVANERGGGNGGPHDALPDVDDERPTLRYL